jgi:hypothetical protein
LFFTYFGSFETKKYQKINKIMKHFLTMHGIFKNSILTKLSKIMQLSEVHEEN